MMDSIDKKILLALLKNARAPVSQIAKTPRLTREIVRNRIPKLVESGVIKAFVARVNQSAFCEGIANLTLKLHRIDQKRFVELISQLRQCSQVNWITELCGTADVMCTLAFTDLENLSSLVAQISDLVGTNLQDHQLSLYINEIKFDRSGLICEKGKSVPARAKKLDHNSISLNKEDLVILSFLATDCRVKNVGLSEKAKISQDAVRLRIRNLEKKGIIQGYTIVLDTSKLGYEGYQIGLRMEQMTPEVLEKIAVYAFENPYITFCARTSGKHNVMLAMEAKDREHFKSMLQDMRSQFKGILTNYEFQLSLAEHKEVFLPEGLV